MASPPYGSSGNEEAVSVSPSSWGAFGQEEILQTVPTKFGSSGNEEQLIIIPLLKRNHRKERNRRFTFPGQIGLIN